MLPLSLGKYSFLMAVSVDAMLSEASLPLRVAYKAQQSPQFILNMGAVNSKFNVYLTDMPSRQSHVVSG